MNRVMVGTAGLIAGGLSLVWAAGLVPVTHACAADGKISYSEDIAPVFRGWCVSCHQPGGEGFKKTGLDLTTYQGLMKGTDYGPMVIAGKPDESNIMRLVNGETKVRMPFEHKPLPACVRQNIWSWIFEGAKDN
ncbi:MAG TPA: c-type cytochrome domain-containing protein [Roseiarcus sp.]|nr:c-type cytochrome domain-containing protein [Roseiarcus sp.]